MKTTIIIFLTLMISVCVKAQTPTGTIDLSKYEMRCGVAHWTNDGIFSCDYKGTYYPAQLFDSTIRKWFIKVVKGDSLFYYRTDVERLYIWNGIPKNERYGYEWKTEFGSTTLGDKYNGSDTLRIMEQIWSPKKQK